MLSSPRPLIYCFEELSRRATNPEGGFPSRAQPPRTLRRPSGAGEGEAACRGRCGGGPPPPQTNRSSAAPDWIGFRALARAAISNPSKVPQITAEQDRVRGDCDAGDSQVQGSEPWTGSPEGSKTPLCLSLNGRTFICENDRQRIPSSR